MLKSLRRCYAKLALKVNESKTAVAVVWGRKFPGYCFWNTRRSEASGGGETLTRMRQRRRSPGAYRVGLLRLSLAGQQVYPKDLRAKNGV